MQKWCINGVVDIIQTPETLEKSGGRENYEIRNRSFLPISVLRSNLYEIPQSLMAQGVRDLTSPCTLMFQYELPRKNVAEMWRVFCHRRDPATNG